jgi:hypothetical protein
VSQIDACMKATSVGTHRAAFSSSHPPSHSITFDPRALLSTLLLYISAVIRAVVGCGSFDLQNQDGQRSSRLLIIDSSFIYFLGLGLLRLGVSLPSILAIWL